MNISLQLLVSESREYPGTVNCEARQPYSRGPQSVSGCSTTQSTHTMAVPGGPGQLLLAVLALSLLSHHCTASPLPPSCKQEPPQQATHNCTYGRTVDSCGSPACLKGPGEMCGGKYGRSVAVASQRSFYLVFQCPRV